MNALPERLDGYAAARVRDVLDALTGHDLAEVRITSVNWPDGPQWVAMTLTADPLAVRARREIPLEEGSQHKAIAFLLRDAFPDADWFRAQDYDVTTGVLREHTPRIPSCLMSEAR